MNWEDVGQGNMCIRESGKAEPAVKANHVYSVDSDMWARGRGLEASKIMAKQIEGFVKQK